MPDTASQRLTLAQQAAAARVAYCLERPGAVALLCGPAGVGKTLVLETIARSRQAATNGLADSIRTRGAECFLNTMAPGGLESGSSRRFICRIRRKGR